MTTRHPIIRGLTLWRPWAAAIVHGPKRIENRPWHPPLRLLDAGLWVAIHAGRRWDAAGAEFVLGRWRVGTTNACAIEGTWPGRFELQGIVGVARVASCIHIEEARKAGDPWAFGPWCWMLDSVHALDFPIACRGAQGLWHPSPDALRILEPLCVPDTTGQERRS